MVNFDFVSYVPVQCFTTFDYIGSMQTTTLMPFLVVGTLITIALIEIFITYNAESDRLRRRTKLGIIYKKYYSVCIIVMSTVLVSVTLKLFNIFNCFDVDPLHEAGDGKDHRFLRVDSAVDCSSSEYYAAQNFAVLFILVYPFGVPMTFFYLLWISKPEITARGVRMRQMDMADNMDNFSKEEKIVRRRQVRRLAGLTLTSTPIPTQTQNLTLTPTPTLTLTLTLTLLFLLTTNRCSSCATSSTSCTSPAGASSTR